jgi:hypothetical protein
LEVKNPGALVKRKKSNAYARPDRELWTAGRRFSHQFKALFNIYRLSLAFRG